MGLQVNTIVTLSDNQKYVVLSETMYQGSKYFLMAGLDDKKDVKSNDVAIFLEIVEGLDTYVKKVVDQELLLSLTKLLKEQM
jgi:hypothetical protein